MGRSFRKGKIYATLTTCRLVANKYGLPIDIFVPLEIGHRYAFSNAQENDFPAIQSWLLQQSIHVDSLEGNADASDVDGELRVVVVDVLEANHCPGACLFLFSLYRWENAGENAGENAQGELFFTTLYTGDFRYIPSLIDHSILSRYAKDTDSNSLVGCENGETRENQMNSIDHIYVDNTYCRGKYTFPSQEVVIFTLIMTLKRYFLSMLLSPPAERKVVVLFSSYTIGKEKVWLAVAKELGLPVFVDE